MAKTGTAIERSPEALPDSSAGEVLPVEIVRGETNASLEGVRAQDARAQRVEVANRVLWLLGSLGNLALRILELRSSVSGSSAGTAAVARPSAQRAVASKPQARPEPRAAGRAGHRTRRRRLGRRYRGDN